MSRLEEHRKAFIANGRIGPLLRIEDLTHEETQTVYKAFVSDQRLAEAETNEDFCRVYTSILIDHGVMCPHPTVFRSYGSSRTSGYGDVIPFDRQRWYLCPICDAICINR